MTADPKRHILRTDTPPHLGSESHQTNSESALEFGTAEELIRHEAATTTVPESVERRLRESLQHEPRPAVPWWRRLFQ